MRLIAAALLVATVQVDTVAASSCEATFVKKGSPVTGLKYMAVHSLTDLSTPDTINQLRGIALGKGYDVLAVEPEAGNMLLEQPQDANRRNFQIIASATTEGAITTVQLQANLRLGVFTKDEAVKSQMCGVLSELKGGKEGVAAAELGKSATAGGGAPTVLTAQTLADRLSKERDKNPDEIPLRYQGRAFTLSGSIEDVRKSGDSFNVVFDILDWEEKALRLPGDSQFKTEIICVLAPGQSVYALSLVPKGRPFKIASKVTLTGTYSDYERSMFWLSDCRPAKK